MEVTKNPNIDIFRFWNWYQFIQYICTYWQYDLFLCSIQGQWVYFEMNFGIAIWRSLEIWLWWNRASLTFAAAITSNLWCACNKWIHHIHNMYKASLIIMLKLFIKPCFEIWDAFMMKIFPYILPKGKAFLSGKYWFEAISEVILRSDILVYLPKSHLHSMEMTFWEINFVFDRIHASCHGKSARRVLNVGL